MELLYEEEDNAFIGLTIDPKLDLPILHIDCKEWSLSAFKRYKKIFNLVKADLRSRGYTHVYGLCEDRKALKFNSLFEKISEEGLVTDDQGKLNILIKVEL